MPGFTRFIIAGIPTVGCNLRCEYCYIKQRGDEDSELKIDTYKALFRYPIQHMLKALTTERLGGICMFNVCGLGETLLCPEIIEITEGLLQNGHYVGLVTNLIIKNNIEYFAKMSIKHRERLYFKASFHYRALKSNGMLNTFAENVKTLKKAGIAYSIEIVSSDYMLPDIDDIKSFSMEHFGALPHVLVARDETVKGKYPRETSTLPPSEYDRVWSSFDSELFSYMQRAYSEQHKRFCYAGEYMGMLLLDTGDFVPCPGAAKTTNFFEDIERPIMFVPMANSCPFPDCFASFFAHALAGVNREHNPQGGGDFYLMRDRLCVDGSHWLSPTIRESFSHRCSEFHEPYSEEKLFFLEMLMRKVYTKESPGAKDITKLSNIVGSYLDSRNFKTVVIYGMGLLGFWLRAILNDAGIDVPYAIDQRSASINCGLLILSPTEETLPVADAIIVTPYPDFTKIAPELRKKTNIPVLSVVELAN